MQEPAPADAPRTAARDEAVRQHRFLVDALERWGRGAGRLLDFGAGSGRFCAALRQRGFDVAAVEPDAGLRAQIRERGVPVARSLDLLGDERFGGAYSIHGLEQVEDDVALLRALREQLAPGGRLFLYVPAFPVLSANGARDGRLRRYRRRSLTERVRRAGFEPTRCAHVDSIGFAAGLWYRHFGARPGGPDPAARRRYDRAVFPLSRGLDALCLGAIGKNLLCEARRVDW